MFTSHSLVFEGYLCLPVGEGNQPRVQNGEGEKKDCIGDQIHHLNTPEQPYTCVCVCVCMDGGGGVRLEKSKWDLVTTQH